MLLGRARLQSCHQNRMNTGALAPEVLTSDLQKLFMRPVLGTRLACTGQNLQSVTCWAAKTVGSSSAYGNGRSPVLPTKLIFASLANTDNRVWHSVLRCGILRRVSGSNSVEDSIP